MISCETFTDLGGGHFCYEDQEGTTFVVDATSSSPDCFYGPAAWDGEPGPHSGERVCIVKPTRLGQYEQASEDDWAWTLPDGTELEDEPPSWPRRLEVVGDRRRDLLAPLEGQVFDTHAELVASLSSLLASLPASPLYQTSADGRLAVTNFRFPHLV